LENLPVGAAVEYDYSQYVHQVPGGMISNLRFQLLNLGLLDRLPEVMEEANQVRKDLGYPIMVTPFSQFVGSQAAINVIKASAMAKSPTKSLSTPSDNGVRKPHLKSILK
jgi:pyruvate/oxaloacetate carboxyltransferase